MFRRLKILFVAAILLEKHFTPVVAWTASEDVLEHVLQEATRLVDYVERAV